MMRYHTRPLLLAALCSFGAACQGQTTLPEPDETDAVAREIVALSQRTNADAFVIFEAAPTDRYVQFANRDGGIIFDLPIQSVSLVGTPDFVESGPPASAPPELVGEIESNRFVSEAEVERLRSVLERFGLNSSSTFEASRDFMGDVVGWSETIRGAYTLSPDSTRQLLDLVFREAYSLQDYQITATTN